MKLTNLVIRVCALLFFALLAPKTFGYTWQTYSYSETVATNGTTRHFRIAIPDDYRYVRGILLNFNASSGDTREEYSKPYFEEFLRIHQFAFIGTFINLTDPPGLPASYPAFTNSIASFATQSGRPEINHAPWAIIVASGGSGLAYMTVKTNDSKVIAWASASGAVGAPPIVFPTNILSVPLLMWAGDNDVALVANAMESVIATNRAVGLRGAYAELQGTTHAQSTVIHGAGIGFLHESILLSYPTNQSPLAPPVTLNRIAEADGWLIDTNTIRSVFCSVTNWSAYTGDRTKAHWVPNKNMAYVYRAFATHSPPISLSSPADETEVNPGANITVAVNVAAYAGWTNITIYSFSTNLANFTSGTPTVTLNNVQSGLYVFHATAWRGGTNVTTKPVMVSVRKTTAPRYPYHWYAANNGLTNNLGTIASPWALRTALTKTTNILGGDFLYLRGGTYTEATPENVSAGFEGDVWQALISGDYGNHITIESYPGEWAVWDGGAYGGIYAYHATARPLLKGGSSADATKGRFLTWKNMEMMSSSTAPRFSATVVGPGTDPSFPTDFYLTDGPNFYGQSNIFANMIVHDLATGISAWEQSSSFQAYGCIVYNNGWVGIPSLHGHGVYTQNKAIREAKVFGTNIICNNYDNSIQAYGSGGAEVYHYRFLGNIIYNNRLLVGGRTDTAEGDNQITGNFQYNSDLVFIYQPSVNALDMLVANNYLGFGMLQGGYWTTAIITNNTIVNAPGKYLFIYLSAPPYGGIPPGWSVNRNTYHAAGTSGQYFNIDGVGPKTFSNWKTATGFDANSTLTAPVPATNMLVLQANIYNTNRAHIASYNWANSNSVALSLSSLGWSALDSVRVRNAQNYFGDITTNTIVGNVLTLDMRASAHSVALPNGSSTLTGPKSHPTFGAFVIERIPSATPTPTNTLTFASSNPGSGVSITATTDLNGNGTGTTGFNRNYLFSTIVALTAPLTAGTNNFSKWQRAGVDYSFSNAISYAVDTNVTLTAVYINPPTTTWTFTAASSNPGSGVAIVVAPNDNAGLGNGSTSFNRTYNDGVDFSFTAPTTAGGNNFQQWTFNGFGVTANPQIFLTGKSGQQGTYTAVYVVPGPLPTETNNISVSILNGPSVEVGIVPLDNFGNGTELTPYLRTYNSGAAVTLTAPYLVPYGYTFVEWQDVNFLPIGSLTNITLIIPTNDPIFTARAVFTTNAALPTVNLGEASSRRRGTR